MNEKKYIYKTTMKFGEDPKSLTGAFLSDKHYTDKDGIKRWRDTDQPIERELRDWDPKQMEFNFDL